MNTSIMCSISAHALCKHEITYYIIHCSLYTKGSQESDPFLSPVSYWEFMFCYFSQFGLEKNCISLMILSLLPQKSCLYFPVFNRAGHLGRSFYNIFFLCPFSILKCGCYDGLLHCSGTSLFPHEFWMV